AAHVQEDARKAGLVGLRRALFPLVGALDGDRLRLVRRDRGRFGEARQDRDVVVLHGRRLPVGHFLAHARLRRLTGALRAVLARFVVLFATRLGRHRNRRARLRLADGRGVLRAPRLGGGGFGILFSRAEVITQ